MGVDVRRMAEVLATKIRAERLCVEQYKMEYGNKRMCPLYSERKGMEQALYALGIKYEYVRNHDDCGIVAVIVGGEMVEVK